MLTEFVATPAFSAVFLTILATLDRSSLMQHSAGHGSALQTETGQASLLQSLPNLLAYNIYALKAASSFALKITSAPPYMLVLCIFILTMYSSSLPCFFSNNVLCFHSPMVNSANCWALLTDLIMMLVIRAFLIFMNSVFEEHRSNSFSRLSAALCRVPFTRAEFKISFTSLGESTFCSFLSLEMALSVFSSLPYFFPD